MKDKLFLVLVLLLSVYSFASLLRPGYFPMHDDMQAMRVLEMDKCVRDLQIPCRWVPDMGYGYGYPQFNFYAPFPYYLMEGFHLFGFSILASVKMGFALTFMLAGVGMYFLAKELWGREGAILSALAYVYLPIHAVDVYVRGAMGEAWALALLPFVFWSAMQVVNGKRHALLFLALSLSALLTSHNVTAVITAPFLVLWILFLIFVERRSSLKFENLKKVLIRVLFATLWSAGLAAFFVLPAFFEKDLVHIESLIGGYFDYRAHFVSIKQLLVDNFWAYGTSEAGSQDEIFLGVGIFHWTISLLGLLLLLVFKKKKLFKYSVFFVIIGFASLFLIHAKSSTIWERVEFMHIFQFPWRFLVIAGFSFSAAVGALAHFQPKLKLVMLVFLSLLLAHGSFFLPKTWININDSEKFSGENWRLQQTISIFDYLPIYSELPPVKRAPDFVYSIQGDLKVIEFEKGSDWQNYLVEASENTTAQLPLYYFPGMRVKVDGEVENFRYDNSLGLITFDLGKGEHKIEAELTNKPIRNVANLISLASLVIIPVVIKRKII